MTRTKLDIRSLMTRQAVAELLEVHPQTITRWEADGCPVARRGGRGRATLYSLPAVVSWRVESARAAAGAAPVSLEAERARFTRAQAERAERENRFRAGELVDADDVTRRWVEIASRVKARLRAIPSAVAPEVVVAAQHGPGVVHALLLARIDEALRELARSADDVAGASA